MVTTGSAPAAASDSRDIGFGPLRPGLRCDLGESVIIGPAVRGASTAVVASGGVRATAFTCPTGTVGRAPHVSRCLTYVNS